MVAVERGDGASGQFHFDDARHHAASGDSGIGMAVACQDEADGAQDEKGTYAGVYDGHDTQDGEGDTDVGDDVGCAGGHFGVRYEVSRN